MTRHGHRHLAAVPAGSTCRSSADIPTQIVVVILGETLFIHKSFDLVPKLEVPVLVKVLTPGTLSPLEPRPNDGDRAASSLKIL